MVGMFDPRTGTIRAIALPSRNLGVRQALVDASERYAYMGRRNGRLGMIE